LTSSVFLDSGIFIALMNRRDQWHEQAVALFSGPKVRWSTSFLVISEVSSWFLHRLGEEVARSFHLLIASLPALKVYEATAAHHATILRMLDRFRGAKLTYVDASSLCLLEQHKIHQVWSTDHHLGLTGVEVLPRSSHLTRR
jgi:predicted nucleic acid-binding protein